MSAEYRDGDDAKYQVYRKYTKSPAHSGRIVVSELGKPPRQHRIAMAFDLEELQMMVQLAERNRFAGVKGGDR